MKTCRSFDSGSGWWGRNPPFHHPMFVLTHHARGSPPDRGGARRGQSFPGPAVIADEVLLRFADHPAVARAMLMAGDAWVRSGVEPPPSTLQMQYRRAVDAAMNELKESRFLLDADIAAFRMRATQWTLEPCHS